MTFSNKHNIASVFFCFIIVVLGSCIECKQVYEDIGVGSNLNFFESVGEQDVFVDSSGNYTILNYQPVECTWPERYNERDAGCSYTRSQFCVQNVEVISGDTTLLHKLSATGWGSWFVFPHFQFDAVYDSPYSHIVQIESIVIQNIAYTGVTQIEVTDTASAIDFIQYTSQNKILRVRMDDGTVWERTE